MGSAHRLEHTFRKYKQNVGGISSEPIESEDGAQADMPLRNESAGCALPEGSLFGHGHIQNASRLGALVESENASLISNGYVELKIARPGAGPIRLRGLINHRDETKVRCDAGGRMA